MALHSKVKAFMKLKPDIAIIPECAHPDIVREKADGFQFANASWIGRSKHKGLGIFSFDGYSIAKSSCFNPKFEQFLPVKITGRYNYNLLAVWAFNHRTKFKEFKNDATTRAALDHYKDFITEKPAVVAGDFNHNVVWDKPGPQYKLFHDCRRSHGNGPNERIS